MLNHPWLCHALSSPECSNMYESLYFQYFVWTDQRDPPDHQQLCAYKSLHKYGLDRSAIWQAHVLLGISCNSIGDPSKSIQHQVNIRLAKHWHVYIVIVVMVTLAVSSKHRCLLALCWIIALLNDSSVSLSEIIIGKCNVYHNEHLNFNKYIQSKFCLRRNSHFVATQLG